MKERKTYKVKEIDNLLVNEESATYHKQDEPLTFNDVWKMFKETNSKYKDIAERFQETDKQFKETGKMYKEIAESFKETDRKFQETDKKFQETDKQFKETDKRLKKLDELFTGQWGKLMESLVEGDLLSMLQARGIKVHRTHQRIKDGGIPCRFEFDILAENGEEAVFVEVKTTLKTENVSYFLEKLKMVKTWLPAYRNLTVYGAMAYLRAESDSQALAEKRGLFVIRATGKSASIINDEDFTPKRF